MTERTHKMASGPGRLALISLLCTQIALAQQQALLAELTQKAEAGDSAAQHLLGRRYKNGEGVRRDNGAAAYWCSRSSENGNLAGQACLGILLLEGQGVRQDQERGDRLIRDAAERGDSYGQNARGYQFYYGRHVSKNLVEAASWYRSAARQGNPLGQFNYATILLSGEGVTADMAEALRMLRMSAEQGYAAAQTRLALHYDAGEGMPKDAVKAVELLQRAAATGYPDAQFQLGLKAAGATPRDHLRAMDLYRLAADQGHSAAMNNLGVLYANGVGPKEDLFEAAKWFRLGADAGDTDAQSNLGLLYLDGRGVSQSDEAAAKLFRSAGGAGNFRAMYWLGRLGLAGRGGAPTGWTAHYWLERSAREGGFANAKLALGLAYFDGIEGSKNYEKAVQWLEQVPNFDQAQLVLGHIYASNSGVTQDVDRAKQHYNKASDSKVDAIRSGGLTALRKIDEIESRRQADMRSQEQARNAIAAGVVLILGAALLNSLTSDEKAATDESQSAAASDAYERQLQLSREQDVESRRTTERYLCQQRGGNYAALSSPRTGVCSR